jgi:hypothetical protein
MNFATFEFAASVGWVGAKRHHFSINIKWIVAGQRTCKNGFPAIFALCPQDRAVWLWPPCVPLSLSQRDKAQLPQWLYANFTLEKKVHGYQRLLALAYRLSLARSERQRLSGK